MKAGGLLPAAAGPGRKSKGKVTSVRIGKLLSVISALAVVVALAGCGGSEDGSSIAPNAPNAKQQQSAEDRANAPADDTLTITVPGMERVKDASIPNTGGDDEEALKNFAGIHLEGTGYPWQEEANVYIAGHRLGYPNTPSFLAFWDIDNLAEGDEVFVGDAEGRQYVYEVFQILEVGPTDLYVTEPMEGRNIVTLQSCTLPDYSRRVVVQGELKDQPA